MTSEITYDEYKVFEITNEREVSKYTGRTVTHDMWEKMKDSIINVNTKNTLVSEAKKEIIKLIDKYTPDYRTYYNDSAIKTIKTIRYQLRDGKPSMRNARIVARVSISLHCGLVLGCIHIIENASGNLSISLPQRDSKYMGIQQDGKKRKANYFYWQDRKRVIVDEVIIGLFNEYNRESFEVTKDEDDLEFRKPTYLY